MVNPCFPTEINDAETQFNSIEICTSTFEKCSTECISYCLLTNAVSIKPTAISYVNVDIIYCGHNLLKYSQCWQAHKLIV